MATKQTKALVNYDEEFAKHAAAYAGMESGAATGNFFRTRGGVLTFQDAPVPGNQMAAVILDHVLENVYYTEGFDPDSPSSPGCFAFGRDEKTMAPHEAATDKQSETCATCPQNAWGSGVRSDGSASRGKACRNTRRLALIPAGSIKANGSFEAKESPDDFATAGVAYMKLPVTSVKGFAGFVQQTATGLKRPPFGIFTKIALVPDPKNQFAIRFEPLETAPKPLFPVLLKRHEEAASTIMFPYLPMEIDAASKKPRGRSAASKKKPAKRAGGRY